MPQKKVLSWSSYLYKKERGKTFLTQYIEDLTHNTSYSHLDWRPVQLEILHYWTQIYFWWESLGIPHLTVQGRIHPVYGLQGASAEPYQAVADREHPVSPGSDQQAFQTDPPSSALVVWTDHYSKTGSSTSSLTIEPYGNYQRKSKKLKKIFIVHIFYFTHRYAKQSQSARVQ